MQIEVKGVEETQKALKQVVQAIKELSIGAVDEASRNIAQNIQVVFKGSPNGFRDKTGALRESIRGGYIGQTPDSVEAFVGAGDERLGSDGKRTEQYAQFVEFPELYPSKRRDTAFLRPGVLMFKREILVSLKDRLTDKNISDQIQGV